MGKRDKQDRTVATVKAQSRSTTSTSYCRRYALKICTHLLHRNLNPEHSADEGGTVLHRDLS
jgi:hypothetical protein